MRQKEREIDSLGLLEIEMWERVSDWGYKKKIVQTKPLELSPDKRKKTALDKKFLEEE